MGVSRKRRLALLATVVLGIALVGAACGEPPPPPAHCPTGPQDAITSTIYSRTNIDRKVIANYGPLWWDAGLACNAQDWANAMASSGNFSHQNLGGLIRTSGYSNFASLGENILVGPGGMTGDAIHVAWMNSPGHYANIMGWYDSIGIAIAYGPDGRVWATEEFGRHF